MGAKGRNAHWDPINVEVFLLSVIRHSFLLIDIRQLIAFLLLRLTLDRINQKGSENAGN